MKAAKALADVKFLSQLLGPFKLWTRWPLFWKIYHLLPTHTHIQKHDCWANKSFQRKQIPFQCSQLYWAGKGEMLFFQYEGKQDLSLFTLSSPFQKKVNLIPSLKKNWGVIYQKTLGSFQAGNHILELCAFSLWPETHEAGLSPLMLWRCQKGRDTVWWCGTLCYCQPCEPFKSLSMRYWAYELISTLFKASHLFCAYFLPMLP